MSTEPQATAAAPAAPKKSRRGLLIVVVLLLVVLAGGGGGAYWFLLRGAPAEAAEAGHEPEKPPATGVVPLEPFVVNLADPGVSRFLRVTLALVVADEAIAKELHEDEVALLRVRSAVIDLLSQKQASELTTPEGKAELKKSIAEGATKAMAAGASHDAEHELEVADVLFAEFIVQF
jgi:flagellar FliL protein